LTYKPLAFDEIEAQFDHDVILIAKNLCDLARYPPVVIVVSVSA
jgi:hypothetical protein